MGPVRSNVSGAGRTCTGMTTVDPAGTSNGSGPFTLGCARSCSVIAMCGVVDGTAAVRRDDHEVAVVVRGDVVGELALLVDGPRSATVVATTAMTIARLAPAALTVVLDECPTITHAVLTTAIRRLAPAA